MNLLGQTGPHVLDHAVIVRLAHQVGQQESGNVDALVGVGVPVVLGDALARHPEDLAAHVGEKARLFVFQAGPANVGEEFLGQNVRHEHLPLGLGRPGTNVLREPLNGLGLFGNGGGLLDGFLHDIVVTRVVGDNEVVNVLVGLDAEGSKENPERNVRLDAGNRGLEAHEEIVLGIVDDFDGVGLGHLVIVGADTLDFHHLLVFDVAPPVAKHKGAILGHALHANHGPLAAHDDEIAANVFGTFTHGLGLPMRLIVQEAVLGTDHDGDLAEVDVGKDTDLGLSDAAAGMVDKGGRDLDVDIQRGRIGVVAEAGVVGEHGMDGAIVFVNGGAANGNLFEFHTDLVFVGNGLCCCYRGHYRIRGSNNSSSGSSSGSSSNSSSSSGRSGGSSRSNRFGRRPHLNQGVRRRCTQARCRRQGRSRARKGNLRRSSRHNWIRHGDNIGNVLFHEFVERLNLVSKNVSSI